MSWSARSRFVAVETGGGDDFAAAYLPAAAVASEQAWGSAALIDLAYPEVWGDRPPDFMESLAFLQGLRAVADEDPDVHRRWLEVVQMARPPEDLKAPDLGARVMAALAQPRHDQPTILARPLES